MAKKKRRKRKKQNFFIILWKIIHFFLKGIYGIFLGVYLLIKALIPLLKKKKEKVIEKKKEKDRPNIEAIYEEFEELESIKGNLEDFDEKVIKGKSTVGLILGGRGSGKSATGLRLLENIMAKTNKKIYAMGFNKEDLPPWINVVNNLEEVENDSVLLVDEGGIQFSARDAMSNMNKLISSILLVSRHRDLSVIFITQSSSNIEINAIRQSDYLILKKSSLMQKDFERKKIKDIYESVSDYFQKYKDKKGLAYIYSDDYRGFVDTNLPSFWSERVSKAFKDFKGKKATLSLF